MAMLGVIVLLSFDSHMGVSDQQAQDQLYCEMVSLHKQDNSVGWPDYKGIYATHCVAK